MRACENAPAVNQRPGCGVRVHMLRSSPVVSSKPQTRPTRLRPHRRTMLQQVIEALVAGREHEQFGLQRRRRPSGASHPLRYASISAAWIRRIFPSAISSEAADVEIIAAAAGAEFQRPAGAVLAEFELEAGVLEPRQQRRVDRFTSSVMSLCAILITGNGTPELRMSRTRSAGRRRDRSCRRAAPARH